MNNDITKVAIINEGCIREFSYENNFVKTLRANGMDRAKKISEADYLLYISCAGTGQCINNEMAKLFRDYIPIVNYYNKKCL